MHEILETTHLEFGKSAFFIDVVLHESGKTYVEITQKINQDNSIRSSIKINPLILNEILEVLQNYRNEYFKNQTGGDVWEKRKAEIQRRYLRGISLKELEMQFGYDEKIIEMMLRNNGIEIVPNEIPKKRWRKR